jgi:hypothetical protein
MTDYVLPYAGMTILTPYGNAQKLLDALQLNL